MGIHLVPGCQARIQVRDANDHVLCQTQCASQNEVKEFIARHGKSKEGFSLLQCSVIPLRTDNLKDFAEDFFLPAFINFTSKINNFVLKLFVSIFAITFDVVTLPIRLITAPFQIYYNYSKPPEKHPVEGLIETNPQAQRAIEAGVVTLHYEVENVQIGNPTHEGGNTFQNATKSVVKGAIQVALKRLPGMTNTQSEEEEKSSFLGMNGDWTLENFSKSSSSYYTFAC